MEWRLRETLYRRMQTAGLAPVTDHPSLRLAEQLRELPPEEAARSYPVQLNGVVTWTNRAADFFFLRDISGMKPEDLVILGEKVDFLERTHLDQLRPRSRVRLTIVGGFDRMAEHIAVHRYFMGLDLKRDISDKEAVTDWYDTVYLPIVKVIRQSKILRDFPGRTEGDMYLWVLDHQRYLSEAEGQALQPPEDAARNFIKTRDE